MIFCYKMLLNEEIKTDNTTSVTAVENEPATNHDYLQLTVAAQHNSIVIQYNERKQVELQVINNINLLEIEHN